MAESLDFVLQLKFLPFEIADAQVARAGMSLLTAALAADGRSVIQNIQQIDRGYERIDERLRALGADIQRIQGRRGVDELAPHSVPSEAT